jgi:hypothetical protein
MVSGMCIPFRFHLGICVRFLEKVESMIEVQQKEKPAANPKTYSRFLIGGAEGGIALVAITN